MNMRNTKKTKVQAVALLFVGALVQPALAVNPIVQTIYTADPAPMIHNGTLYVYTGHDEDKSTWFTMKDWHCYSTKDMVNWTDHGSPLSYTDFNWARSDAWAGQCIERNGKFYFYVPMNQKGSGMAIGVAVSDSPTGPFKDAIGRPLVFDKSGDIDPTVFLDDDGQAYLYWGNPVLKYVKLNADMISYDTSIGDKGIVRVPMTVESFGKRSKEDRPTAYEEGPWLYKRNGLYYLVHASGPIPEHLGYSTSSKPTGPWEYRGVIMPTEGGSFTNHPGVVDYQGHSYLFYHNGALPGGGGFTRSVAGEEFQYNADGSFPTIKMTKEGPKAIATLDPYDRVEAETIAVASGVETQRSSQGGMSVCDIDDGDYIQVKNVDFGQVGAGTFSASVASVASDAAPEGDASKNAGSQIELRLDGPAGPVIGTLPVPYTGGATQWKNITAAVSGATGVHDLYLMFKGDQKGDLFNIDFWKFGKKGDRRQLVALQATSDTYQINSGRGSAPAKVKVWAIYADGTRQDVTKKAKWTPSQRGLLKFKNGQITGLSHGSTPVDINYQGKTDTLNFIVKDLKSDLPKE
jgi:hypothetical protein